MSPRDEEQLTEHFMRFQQRRTPQSDWRHDALVPGASYPPGKHIDAICRDHMEEEMARAQFSWQSGLVILGYEPPPLGLRVRKYSIDEPCKTCHTPGIYARHLCQSCYQKMYHRTHPKTTHVVLHIQSTAV